MANPLVDMQRLGQSPWHDNIRRGLLTSGELARMRSDGDITGLTSNPTIFEQAIAHSDDYDDAISTCAAQGKSAEDIFDQLSIEDIRNAADVFRSVYDRTQRKDGYVSIEVKPTLANDTRATIQEAHRLWNAVQRPNLMVKIPATPEGVPAIKQCISDGLNINVTLIFSLDRYDEVMDAYLGGLRARSAVGKPIDHIASVASFFVSRVDTAVDKILDQKIGSAGPDQAAQLQQLKGKAGIANAKLAYLAFRRKFQGDSWNGLKDSGAQLQRPLWASTSTKNPSYPDTYYVDALIGSDTVDTMPPATIKAYKDHGKPEARLERNLDEAAAVLQRLEDAGVSMDAVTQKLEEDGVAAFSKSYVTLIDTVKQAVAAVKPGAPAAAAAGINSGSPPAAKPAPARAAPAKAARPAAKRAAAAPARKAGKTARPKPAAARGRKRAAKKPKATRKAAGRKPAARKAAVRKATRKAARKPAARKTATRKTARKPTARRKPAPRKTAARTVKARKAVGRKSAGRTKARRSARR